MLQCDTPAVACAAGPANKSCYCAQHNLHVGQAHTIAFARYLRASFADDVQFSPSLDDFAGVTQSLDGRTHAHRVTDVLELSRAFSSLRQSTTQRRYGRVSTKPIELGIKLRPEMNRCVALCSHFASPNLDCLFTSTNTCRITSCTASALVTRGVALARHRQGDLTPA